MTACELNYTRGQLTTGCLNPIINSNEHSNDCPTYYAPEISPRKYEIPFYCLDTLGSINTESLKFKTPDFKGLLFL